MNYVFYMYIKKRRIQCIHLWQLCHSPLVSAYNEFMALLQILALKTFTLKSQSFVFKSLSNTWARSRDAHLLFLKKRLQCIHLWQLCHSPLVSAYNEFMALLQILALKTLTLKAWNFVFKSLSNTWARSRDAHLLFLIIYFMLTSFLLAILPLSCYSL